MCRKYKWVGAVVLLLIAGVVIFWQLKSQTVMEEIAQQIGDVLTESIGQNVKIGSVTVSGMNELQVNELEIDDQIGQPILQAPKVRVHFSVWRFLWNHEPAIQMIEKIELLTPQLFVAEQADGSWNITELLHKNQGKQQGSLRCLLEISDGQAIVRLAQGEWQAQQVNGTISLRNNPAIEFSIKGLVAGNSLTASGTVGGNGSLRVTLRSPSVDLTSFTSLLAAYVPNNELEILSGQLADTKLTVEKKQGQMTFSGESELKNVAVNAAGQQLRAVNGLITFDSDKVTLYRTSATLDGQAFSIGGDITINATEPVVNLTVTAQNTDLSALPLPQTVAGNADFSLHIAGPLSDPMVDGTVQVSNVSADGYTIERGHSQVHYYEDNVKLDDLLLWGYGGSVGGTATLNLKNQTITASLTGRHIDTAPFAAMADVPISGFADFTTELAGPLDVKQLAFALQASVPIGSYGDLNFQRLTVDMVKDANGAMDIRQAQAETADGGFLSAAGTVSQGELNLFVLADQVEAAPLAAEYVAVPAAGRVSLNGMITGSVESPGFSGQIFASNGQIALQPFDYLSGNVSLNQGELTLEHLQGEYRRSLVKNGDALKAQDLITTYQANGTIGLTGEKKVNITASAQHMRAEDLAAMLAPGENVTGTVDADVKVAGTLDQPDAYLAANFADGSYRGYLVRRAEALIQHHQGVTTVDHLVIHSLPGNLELSGTIDAAQQMNFAVDIKNIRMSRLPVNLPYPLTGRGDFTGKLTGTPDHPKFTGDLVADKLTINGQAVEKVVGRLWLNGSDLHIANLEFHQGQGLIHLRGAMNLDKRTFYGRAELINGSVSRIAPIFNLPADQWTGTMNGQMLASGSLDNPTVLLTGRVTEGSIKHFPLDPIDLDVEMADHVVTINNFEARQGKGRLILTGSADLNGKINMNLFGSEIDSGVLPAWLNRNIPLHGDALVSMELTGETKSPQAAVSIDIEKGSLQGEGFDSLTGSFIVNDQLLDMNQVTLTKGQYVASATGKIPMATLLGKTPEKKTFDLPVHYSQISNKLLSDDEMDIKVMLDQSDLSALPIFSRRIAWASGATKGMLLINGTPDNPKFYGDFSVANGTIKFADLKQPLKNLSIDIGLRGDKIVVNTFKGQMGQGSLAVDGSASLTGREFTDYALNLRLDQLELDHQNFRGPLSGTLQLTPQNGTPLLTGQILLENDTVNIPTLPEFSPSKFDMVFNFDVTAGKNLRFYNPYLYDFYVDGKVTINGTFQHPAPAGTFTVSRGQITYFTAPFKIETASAEFTPYNGWIPQVKLTSRFDIQQTSVTLAVNGPANAMNFNLTATPAMTQESILSLLTLRSRYFDRQNASGRDNNFGRDEMNSLFSSGIESQLFSPVENTFRSLFGVDDFHIVHSTDVVTGQTSTTQTSHDVYNVELNKYLNDRVSLNYSMGVDHASQQYGVRYDFNEHVSAGVYYGTVSKFQWNLMTRYQF